MAVMSTLVNGLLLGASGYAMYIIKFDYPYAFTACAVIGCHAICGIACSMHEESEEHDHKVPDAMKKISELFPLPLINTELLLKSSSSMLALGHGLCILPLAIAGLSKLLTYIMEGGSDYEQANIDTLEMMTFLGNVMALSYLALNEENYLYATMAGTSLIFYCAPSYTEEDEVKKMLTSLGETVLCVLTSIAVEAFGKEA